MPSLTLSGTRPRTERPTSGARPGTLRHRLSHPSVFLFVILTAQMMVVLDATIVNVALPHIQQSLGFSSSTLSWVLNAYILTFGGLLLLGARAGDLFGRRRIFLVGIAVFTVSSLVGGLAPVGWMLLAARATQGIGAALAAPSALSLLTTVFAEGQPRVRAIGLYTTVSAAGGAAGLVAGGLLTQLVSWRWVMFVNVPIGVTVWLLGRIVIVETERRRGRFDLAGALTCTVGVSAIVFGLVEAGPAGWTSPVTVSALTLGLVLLGLFLRQEQRVDEPILPLRLLTHGTRSSANAGRALLYAGFYGLFYFMAQFLQDAQGYSPLTTGLAFLPLPVSVFLSSQLTSRVLLQRISQKAVMALGTAVATVGLLLATQVDGSTGYFQIVVSLVLIGAGSGAAFVALTSASLAEVAAEDAGAASGLVNVSQQIGAALGLAVLVTIFDSLTGHAQLRGGTGSSAQATTVVHALDAVFGFGALFALAALVTILVGIQRARADVLVAPAAQSDDNLLRRSPSSPSPRALVIADRGLGVQDSVPAPYHPSLNTASSSSAMAPSSRGAACK
ncbi:MAG: MFS transporter [Acidimicrobiales bacterium]